MVYRTLRMGLILCLISTTQLDAEVYKWRDSEGKLHFSDSPPANAKAQKLSEKDLAARISSFTNVTVEITPIDFGVNKQANAHQVVMYSSARCPYCAKARAYFSANDIEYQEKNIDDSKEYYAEFKAIGGKGVPVILSGKYRMNGFNANNFAKLYQKSIN